ncbi:hypothetical protein [Ignatzschineria larvae]|nr:hypothetical protein [Ignatzschineria larvae]
MQIQNDPAPADERLPNLSIGENTICRLVLLINEDISGATAHNLPAHYY